MSLIGEKVAYLRGIAESMQTEGEVDQSKLINIIIDTLSAISDELDEINEAQDELFDHVFDIEDVLDFDSDDESDSDTDEDGYTGEYVVECPQCKEEIYLDDDMMQSESEVRCSKCGTEIILEFHSEDACDCGKPHDFYDEEE